MKIKIAPFKRGASLTQQVSEYLQQWILQMEPGNNKLPSEEEICEQLNISRATLRIVLKELTAKGMITSLHGKGTYGHSSVLQIENRLDLTMDFLVLLRQSHDSVRVAIDWKGERAPSAKYCALVNDDEAMVNYSEWTYYAEEVPLLYGKNEIAVSAFRREFHGDPAVNSITKLSKHYLKNPVPFCSVQLTCCSCTEEVAKVFDIPVHTPIQCWEEVFYDVEDYRIGHALYYLHPQKMVMSVVSRFQ